MRPILLLPLLCTAIHALAAPVTVQVMAQDSLPPKWINNEGQPEGVCPDILAAMERAEPQLHFAGSENFRSIPVIEKGLETGQLGAACALLDTPQRQRIARRSARPLYMVRHRIAAAADDSVAVNSLQDLVRLQAPVATSRGAGYADQLRKLGLTVDESTGDNLVNLKKVIAGHDRFFYMNDQTMSWLLRKYELQDKVRVLPVTLKEEPIYFWISRKTPPATARLMESALDKIHASGELARISERWTVLP